MKVLKVTIQNVMRISELTLDTSQNHLILVGGKNGQGKTSVLLALLMTLCGKRGLKEWPDVALREGEDHGECEIEFELAADGSDNDVFPDMKSLTVRRQWDRQRDGSIKESLTIVDETGTKAASPQQLLNDLFKTRAFNPLELELLDKHALREMLMDLVGLREQYDANRVKRQTAYEARALIQKQGKTLAAQVEGMPFHEDAPDAEVSVSTLLDELQVAEKKNAEVTALRGQATLAQQQLESRQEALEKMREKLKEAEASLKESEKEVKKLAKEAKDTSFVETDEIRARIDSVEADNAKVRCNAQHAERTAELKRLRAERDEQNAIVEACPVELQAMLEAADWPIDGLSVDDEGVLYRGLPVTQASRAERIRLWCRVSAALNPKLKLLVFPDGNDLDNDSLKELDEYLTETDYQAIVEFVTRSQDDTDRCAVVLEDGHDAKVAAHGF
jgi:recombinational DNA repair ATPase RecF